MLLFSILNACGVRLIDELCAKSDGTGLTELRIYQGLTTGHGKGSVPLRSLRDEDKGLKWTKKSQFASEIRNVYQQVAASVKGREFKVKKSPPRNVKAASFSPLPTTSLGARFMYINTTALLEINNAIIDINTSAQGRARMTSTAQNKPHMFKQKSIIYQTPKTPGADNTEEASRFCNICIQASGTKDDTVVIWGNGNFTSLGRKQGAPTKALKRHARRYTHIITYDEYMTSQRCSHCARRGAPEAVADDLRLSGLASVLEDAGCFGAQHCQPLHAVRYCETCSTVWDRDYNAARNILYCFLYERAFAERPRPFRRV
ncbi:hypothetical protein SeLEV6574_g01101 [Synchytrium endobioticum]|uniref:Cas12f1-like TNB domain-containing protein n=1 Tax=Synchytrium endobioticum TaxID=286115 RepID=A0A507DH07_9FUNG|nr:hypothetical protein SeLEV6574_g01101 [Synchytrium endobioticum]